MKSLIATTTLLMSLLVVGQAEASSNLRIQLVDSDGAPVPGAVIYLEGVGDGLASLGAPVIVDQINKQFVPRVTVVQTGTQIDFPNRDEVSHHVYSFANPNSFELPLYKGTAKPGVRFDHAGLVTLGCNIHDSMLGYILVVDSPYHAVTDSNGGAELSWSEKLHDNQPIRVWSPDLANGETLTAAVESLGVKAPASGIAFRLVVNARQESAAVDAGHSLNWGDY